MGETAGDTMEETILVDGINICYRVEGEGEPLLLLHGMACSHGAWDKTITQASRFFTVYAPDLPGFGGSEKPVAEYGLPFYVDFLAKFLDALGIARCALAGMSMGGEIVAAFAAQNPERVVRLAMIDPKGFSPLIRGLRTISVLGSPLYVFMFNNREILKRYFKSLFFDTRMLKEELVEQEWARLKDPAYRNSLSRNAKYLSTVDPGLPKTLEAITARTLIIWGREDAILPLEDAYRFKGSIANSEVVVLERCGHAPVLEKNDECNKALITFLAEVEMYYADD